MSSISLTTATIGPVRHFKFCRICFLLATAAGLLGVIAGGLVLDFSLLGICTEWNFGKTGCGGIKAVSLELEDLDLLFEREKEVTISSSLSEIKSMTSAGLLCVEFDVEVSVEVDAARGFGLVSRSSNSVACQTQSALRNQS